METKELLKSVDKLALKLGTTAEKLFGYYLKEAKLFRVYFFINLLVGIVFFIVGAWLFIDSDVFHLGHNDSYTAIQWLLLISGILLSVGGFIVIIVQAASIETVVRSIKNPEYMASEELLSTLFNKD